MQNMLSNKLSSGRAEIWHTNALTKISVDKIHRILQLLNQKVEGNQKFDIILTDLSDYMVQVEYLTIPDVKDFVNIAGGRPHLVDIPVWLNGTNPDTQTYGNFPNKLSELQYFKIKF